LDTKQTDIKRERKALRKGKRKKKYIGGKKKRN
jgi:hypothetical protein